MTDTFPYTAESACLSPLCVLQHAKRNAPSYEGAIKSNGGAAQETGPPKEKEMGYQGCPCYRDYFLKYGEYCDRNGQSCADCPLLEVARKKSGN
jgi:hypothetical protein